MDERKRKAAPTAPQRKKPRRSTRDKSEFVSVEVGMREFKKRLADDALTGEKKPSKQLTTPAKRATSAKKADSAKRVTRATARKTATKQLTLAEVKLQLQQEQEQRVQARVQTLQQKSHAKETAANTTPASIQAVAPAIAATSVASSASAVEDASGEISVAINAVGPDNTEATTSVAAAASATFAVSSRDDSADGKMGLSAHVDFYAQQQSCVKQNGPELAQSTPAQQTATDNYNAHLDCASTPVAASVSELVPSAANEFIADDEDEDLIFAMALEEVEQKLLTPQKPPLIAKPKSPPPPKTLFAAVSPPSNQTKDTQESLKTMVEATIPEAAKAVGSVPVTCTPFVSAAVQEPELSTAMPSTSVSLAPVASFPAGSSPVLSSPATSVSAPSSAQPAPAVSVPSSLDVTPAAPISVTPVPAAPSAVLTSDVLEEMERLRQENESLRRFNELLKASAASPQQDTPPVKSQRAARPRKQRTATRKTGARRSERDKEIPSSMSAPRFLDLGRHDSDIDIDQEDSAAKENQIQQRSTSPSREDYAVPSTTERDDCLRSETSDVHNDESDHASNEMDSRLNYAIMEMGENEADTYQSVSLAAELSSTDPPPMDQRNNQHWHGEDEDDEMDEGGHRSLLDDESHSKSLPSVATAHAVDGNATTTLMDEDADATPTNSDIIERTTTVPSYTDDDDEEEEDEIVMMKKKARPGVIASSSSDSESESEEEDGSEPDTAPTANVLEAALRAAGGDSAQKQRIKPDPSDRNLPKMSGMIQTDSNQYDFAATTVPSTSPPAKAAPKKRKTASLSRTSKSAVKSSLLWPTLDEFYDFLLGLSPRNVRGAVQTNNYFQLHHNGKLPLRHSSIDEYCGLHLEAIMEELVASVSNSMDKRGGSPGPTRHLPLASVSPCSSQGVSASAPVLGLSFGAIFSESGFSGNTSSSNDFILALDASVLGKNSSDFLSGDLVLVRSPRWKNYEMSVFGVVLCNSIVAVGGRSGKNSTGSTSENDQICVLIRAREESTQSFGILTELCLSNQRSPNWRWSIQQVHNTTTSAREFQAIKSISFFSIDLKQLLVQGRLLSFGVSEQGPGKKKKTDPAASILSPQLLKYLQEHYNESQVQAILGCLGEESRVLIQGPPGTGKTKTILGLLSALLDGAGLSTLQKTKGTARVRIGASLQTAKTSTVSKTVVETSIRILVAAPSNAAVDELVLRVLSEGLFDGEKGESYRPRIVRVGKPECGQQKSSLAAAREASESKKNRKKMRKYAREVEEVLLESLVTKHRKTFPTAKQARQAIIKNAQIVFCTLSGAGSVAMCDFAQDFDALIIDEAAQAVEASTLIPFKFRPHRVVLVGDHRQLPATVISKKLVTMGYDKSLLQRLVENESPVLLLTKQYRMHPEIAEFPSTYFYGGRLVQDAKMSEWTAREYHTNPLFRPLLFMDVQGGAQSQVNGSTSLRNLSEVEVVIQLVRHLVRAHPGVDWKKRIGVIAPYKQQIYEVRAALGRLESECDQRLGIEVNTVDGFQGREKEIIIYSCVRTSHGGRKRKKKNKKQEQREDSDVLDAFWADERRMNVAITRAKSSLWIVGNSTLLKQNRAWRALIQHAKDHDRYVADAGATVSDATSASRSSSESK